MFQKLVPFKVIFVLQFVFLMYQTKVLDLTFVFTLRWDNLFYSMF